jgi:hypothetical protein
MDDATAADRHLRGDVTDLNLGTGHRIVRQQDEIGELAAGSIEPF